MKPTKNKNIYTTHHLIVTDEKGFTKKCASVCVNAESDDMFVLLDTAIDYASLPKPTGLTTVKLKMVKRGESHE